MTTEAPIFHQAPTPENYAAWYADRVARTTAIMATTTRISGNQIRRQNLSMKVLYNAGWKLNNSSDTMEKPV